MPEHLRRARDMIELPTRTRFLITNIPQLHSWEVVDLETDDKRIIRFKNETEQSKLTDFLTHMYLTVGTSGPRDIKTIRDYYSANAPMGVVTRLTGNTAAQLHDILPEGAIKITPRYNESLQIMEGELSFGALAISSRQATPQELETFNRAPKTVINPEEKSRVEEADRRKEQLTEYDHALISVGGKGYLLSLDTDFPESFLAARVIQNLFQWRVNVPITPADFVRETWGSLSLAERALLVKDEARIYSGKSPRPIHDKVFTILRTLARPLQIIDSLNRPQQPGGNNYIEFIADPPSPERRIGFSQIYPPGTDIQVSLGEKRQPPSPEKIAGAKSALEVIADRSSLTPKNGHYAAIMMLDVVMDQEGKRALNLILQETGSSLKPSQAREQIHALAKSLLGDTTYQAAIDARTIKGNLVVISGRGNEARGRVTLQSGTTSRRTRRNLTSSWYIGKPIQGE